MEVAVIYLESNLIVDCSAELLQCRLDRGDVIVGVGKELCLDWVRQQSIDREIIASSILVLR